MFKTQEAKIREDFGKSKRPTPGPLSYRIFG